MEGHNYKPQKNSHFNHLLAS